MNPTLGALASRRRVSASHQATRRRDAGAPRFMAPMRDFEIVEAAHENRSSGRESAPFERSES